MYDLLPWVALGLATLLAFAHVGVRAARLTGSTQPTAAPHGEVRIRRRWLPWNFSVETPAGTRYDALAYSQAFDASPPGCPYCNRGIRMLCQRHMVHNPHGAGFEKSKCVGYVCVHCRLAAPDDICMRAGWREKWVPIAEYEHEAPN